MEVGYIARNALKSQATAEVECPAPVYLHGAARNESQTGIH